MDSDSKTKILVIDDEESIRYSVDAGLEFIGDYNVQFADDGPSGIESLKQFAPDLVLLDLVLPNANGMEVLEAIRNNPEISKPQRVVLMTGHTNPVEESHFGDLGIDRILSKPFKLDQLKSALFE